ncbi:MAG TPA: tRNA dihydrouridine synthase DusB [Geobacteraceae bacterium]
MIRTLTIGPLTLPNNLLLAPMAGITNLPMRLMARKEGAALCFTEMVSVNGLVREGKKTFDLLRSTPADRPLGIQLFGDDPELMAEGARLVAGHGDLIDLNMGCPVRKVVNSGAGSALLREPDRVRAIIRRVRAATTLPVTIKIRTGWEAHDASFLEIGRIAEDEGCDAVTLHPRSRTQMFEGKADWSRIRELKKALSIPVLGSGDLFSAADVVAMLGQTGCDGVMVARGALGNPWIFRETLAMQAGREPLPPTPEERGKIALRHLELFIATFGERVALREMRKHLCWYARGVPGAAQFRALANRLQEKEEIVRALQEFFCQGPS